MRFSPKALFLLPLLLLLPLLFTACGEKTTQQAFHLIPMEKSDAVPSAIGIINPDSEIRGVWIASVFNIDYPSAGNLSADQLKRELDAILDTCTKNKLNTIFFQVRPACDALYQSELFPVSPYLSSNGTLPFDPLDYLVKEAHLRNIYVHAWVNPLRVTVAGNDLNALPEGSPAKEHPEWTVSYADGKLYFNAGLPEVRQLIADGVREIVENYDVDGVVFDDYFYPYPVYDDTGVLAVFDDSEEYESFGGMFDNIADWRRENINQIIRLCYNAVHETDPDCVFGVAPAGVWQNNDGKNGGSDTRGFEAYHSLYCDALAWIRDGSIDYISPQIYWDFNASATPYDVVLRWWNAALDGSDVKLYVSHASYKYEDGNWTAPEGQLTEQVEFARSERSYRGSIFYGYDEINRNIHGASDDLIAAYRNEIIYADILSNGHGVTITSPEDGSTMTAANTYLIGTSDPFYPLTLNGAPVSRTKSGYFSMYVTLKPGENVFTFLQNGVEYKYTLHYQTDTASAPAPEKEPTILSEYGIIGLYPEKDVTTDADGLWVSCVAPYGSQVTATVGGTSFALEALENPKNKSTKDGYIGIIYGKQLTLPKADDGTVLDLGKVEFRAELNHQSATAQGCNVRLLGKDGKIGVTVIRDYTHLKFTETSSYYNDYTVQSAGMTDTIVSQKNGFYRLKMGGYVSEENVEETTDFPTGLTAFEKVTVNSTGRQTEIRLQTKDRPAYYGVVEDGRFVLTFYNIDTTATPDPIIRSNPLVDGCEVIRHPDKNRVRYSFRLLDVNNFYGFDLRYEENDVVVTLRNPRTIDESSSTPLSGLTFVLDAGHGGWDRGAAGPLAGFHEKDMNLAIVLEAERQLKELGAEIILLRSDDSAVDIYDRMARLEEIEPDLCVSVHQNSMNYTSDITRIRGTLALYCMDSGRLLAQCIGDNVAEETGRLYRGAQYQMLGMCRNPKFPQMLLETGFITSVEEYEQMANGSGVVNAARGIVNGILEYYRIQGEYLKAGQ